MKISQISQISHLSKHSKIMGNIIPKIYIYYILKFIYINFKKEEPPNLSPQMRDLSNERFERFERKRPDR